MTARPDERRFYLCEAPSQYIMDCIYQWAPRQSVYCHWLPNRDLSISDPRRYCVIFRQWTRIKPEYRTALELMLSS